VIKSNLVKCQSSSDLSYAIFISRLINHFDIDTVDENVIKIAIFDQRIGILSLGKLEIVLDPANNMYKRKKDLILQSTKEVDEDNLPPIVTKITTHAALTPSDPSL